MKFKLVKFNCAADKVAIGMPAATVAIVSEINF